VAVAEGRSVTQALREARARRVDYCALAKVYRNRKTLKIPTQDANAQGGPIYPPPPVCAPDRRPARLLGCLASPRLLASGRHSALPVYPSCLHIPGAGVPTQGTSHWGHPLGESNAPPGPTPVACLVADA
jgi:hypothetical protein